MDYFDFWRDSTVEGMELFYKYCLDVDMGQYNNQMESIIEKDLPISECIDFVFEIIQYQFPILENYFLLTENSLQGRNLNMRFISQGSQKTAMPNFNLKYQEELENMSEKIESYLKEDVLLLVVLGLIEIIFQDKKGSASITKACEAYTEAKSTPQKVGSFNGVYNNAQKSIFDYINTPLFNLVGGMFPNTETKNNRYKMNEKDQIFITHCLTQKITCPYYMALGNKKIQFNLDKEYSFYSKYIEIETKHLNLKINNIHENGAELSEEQLNKAGLSEIELNELKLYKKMKLTQTIAFESLMHTYYFSSLIEDENIEILQKKINFETQVFRRCVGTGAFLPAFVNRKEIMILLLKSLAQPIDEYVFSIKQLNIVILNLQHTLFSQLRKDIGKLAYYFMPSAKHLLLSTLIRKYEMPTKEKLSSKNAKKILTEIFKTDIWKNIEKKIIKHQIFFSIPQKYLPKSAKDIKEKYRLWRGYGPSIHNINNGALINYYSSFLIPPKNSQIKYSFRKKSQLKTLKDDSLNMDDDIVSDEKYIKSIDWFKKIVKPTSSNIVYKQIDEKMYCVVEWVDLKNYDFAYEVERKIQPLVSNHIRVNDQDIPI